MTEINQEIENMIAEMRVIGQLPAPDRIDNDGDYSPENCRWVTAKDNSRNKRTNRLLAINGKTKTVSEWCEVYDVSPYTVYWWIREKGYKYAEEKVQSQNTRAPILSAEEMKILNG